MKPYIAIQRAKESYNTVNEYLDSLITVPDKERSGTLYKFIPGTVNSLGSPFEVSETFIRGIWSGIDPIPGVTTETSTSFDGYIYRN